MVTKKSVLALAGAALLAGGCATGPYYDQYAYNEGGTYYERPVYRDDVPVYRYYDHGPAYSYYSPFYYGPTIGLGFSFSNRHHWRRR